MAIKDRIKALRRVRGRDLLPSPKNWRIHPQAQRDALNGVLAQVGYADAVLVRELEGGALEIIDGHLRVEEADPDQELPVLVLDVTDAEADLILATHDPLGAMAAPNLDLYLPLIEHLEPDSEAVSALLEAVANNEARPLADLAEPPDEGFDVGDAVDDVEADDYEPTVQWGEVWSLGQHRLMCGDSLDGDMEALAAGVDFGVAVTDPPYAIMGSSTGSKSDTALIHPFFRALWQCLRSTGVHDVYMCSDWRSFPTISAEAHGWEIKDVIVWDKGSGGLGNPYRRRHEFIVFARPRTSDLKMFHGERPGGRSITDDDVWQFQRDRDKQHNAAKPVPLLARCIENSTVEGEIVLDPFVGSGTTIIAAERLGRRCYAMEIEPRYCDVTIKRWEDYTGRKAALIEQIGVEQNVG